MVDERQSKIVIDPVRDRLGVMDMQPAFMPGGESPVPDGEAVAPAISRLLGRPFRRTAGRVRLSPIREQQLWRRNRRHRATFVLGAALCAVALAMPVWPVLACGDAEGSGSCAGASGAANKARWMLKRVAAAVQADEPRALGEFTRGTDGFRTKDTYVFCIGLDGRMSAHPDPKLVGQDARAQRDPTGKAFAVEMLDVAREDQVAEVSYFYPRPGSTVPVPKSSFVTRIKNQVCGVGYYDLNVEEPAESATSSSDRLARLRQRFGADMPADLRPDWTAFLGALDARRDAQEAAFANARKGIQAAEAAMTTTFARSASNR